jgi:hypothetical protein
LNCTVHAIRREVLVKANGKLPLISQIAFS